MIPADCASGIWYDERLVSIPTGDPIADAIYNMERAGRDYTLPQHYTLNGDGNE